MFFCVFLCFYDAAFEVPSVMGSEAIGGGAALNSVALTILAWGSGSLCSLCGVRGLRGLWFVWFVWFVWFAWFAICVCKKHVEVCVCVCVCACVCMA